MCVCPKDSFTGAKSWVKELQRRGDPSVVIALAGNKVGSRISFLFRFLSFAASFILPSII